MSFCKQDGVSVSLQAWLWAGMHMHICFYICMFISWCVSVVYYPWWHPSMLSCATQSWSSLSILPGPVLVFRAPPEGPLAWWERCWRRPGPAALLPSPSTGCQAQRVPLASRAWQRGCLHSQCRVWTGQGGCHVMLNGHVQEGQLARRENPLTHTCRRTHFHEADSWRVWHMFGRSCKCWKEVCAGEKHHKWRLQRPPKYLILLRILRDIWVALPCITVYWQWNVGRALIQNTVYAAKD